MTALVNTISGRLSLRPSQRIALSRLATVIDIAPPAKTTDSLGPLKAIRSEFRWSHLYPEHAKVRLSVAGRAEKVI